MVRHHGSDFLLVNLGNRIAASPACFCQEPERMSGQEGGGDSLLGGVLVSRRAGVMQRAHRIEGLKAEPLLLTFE
jgi:hypothetical protein